MEPGVQEARIIRSTGEEIEFKPGEILSEGLKLGEAMVFCEIKTLGDWTEEELQKWPIEEFIPPDKMVVKVGPFRQTVSMPTGTSGIEMKISIDNKQFGPPIETEIEWGT